MHTFTEEFRDALSMIELGDKRTDRAIEAHKEVRGVLEADEQLRSWGVKTRLIGSYGRSTAIHPGRDVDVFAMLPDTDDDVSPNEVHEAIKAALRAHGEYEGRLSEGKRSVKVDFPDDDFAVDVVGAVPSGDRWKIPQADDDGNQTAWQETDPLEFGDLTSTRNEEPEVDGRGVYVPTVKLVRQIRKHHLDDRKPGGLYFEMETYWAFENGVSGDSWAEVLTETLEHIATQAESGAIVTDPAMDSAYSPAPEASAVNHAAEVFRSLANDARAALEAEECPAAATWRRILGRNERAWVFVIPDGCDEHGEETESIAVVKDRGPREAQPFA